MSGEELKGFEGLTEGEKKMYIGFPDDKKHIFFELNHKERVYCASLSDDKQSKAFIALEP